MFSEPRGMDPMLQRLGDVTIQRLEKPKELKDSNEHLDEENVQKETKEEEAPSLKRNVLESAGPSQIKKFKYDKFNVTLTKKGQDEFGGQSFSENEMSEYDTESDIESEGEVDLNKYVKEEELEPSDVEEEEGSDFLEKLVEQESLDEDIKEEKTPVEVKVEKEDDYEYDIKEKLKEMGEISFETVKKGDRPKKVETTENEVIVTKKTGKKY